MAEGRAFVDRGITDHSEGSREAVAAATTRRLAAILAADVAGYSRLMGADEEGTLNRLKAHRRELVDPKIREHHGRIVKTTGDGMLVEFPSVVDAVRCAVEMQRAMVDRNADMPEDKRITFRIGVNLGDVIADGGDIYGDGVNIAARLEALAEPGGICISRTVRDHIGDRLPYAFDDIGRAERQEHCPAGARLCAERRCGGVDCRKSHCRSRRRAEPAHRSRLAILVAALSPQSALGSPSGGLGPKSNPPLYRFRRLSPRARNIRLPLRLNRRRACRSSCCLSAT